MYGVAEFGIFLIGVVEGFFLQTFLLEVAEISTYEVLLKNQILKVSKYLLFSQSGTILMIAQIWNGICDPIVGRFPINSPTEEFDYYKGFLENFLK